ncbi:MAG: TIGR00730 family Rossman fold protein [Flavobacteriales bacterium]
MQKIVVFCGSSIGTDQVYSDAAKHTGMVFAKRGIDLVYGGGGIGLMGIVANTMMENGARVTGVIPKFLATKEIANNEITELIIVDTMHERKALMSQLSDAVLVLPGGIGTLEEFFEVFTWGQLGLHQKPIAILNINGFYNPLIELIDHMRSQGFLRYEHFNMLIVSDSLEEILTKMEAYSPPPLPKWFSESEI